MIKNLIKKIIGTDRFNSVNYWENRYAKGGNSGDGSYGRLSQFKADFVNKFIDKNDIKSIVELGCGDGHQLSIIHYPSYIGLDVSQTIIDLCRNKFQSDPTKRFFQYKPDSFVPNEPFKAELALSLDVLYHIVEDKYYHKYLNDLFSLSTKYVVIYSTNFSLKETQHVLHRRFTEDISDLSGWVLAHEVKNPFPGKGKQESLANFYVFKKKFR